MTDRISIPALRGFQGHHLTIADAQHVVSALPALVEAVEAAAALTDDETGSPEVYRRLAVALARFDFGEET